jgi:hypothetical protein
MQTIYWLGMRLSVPDDWEVVRHGIHARKGRLVFVDRRRQRLVLSWVTTDRPPEVARLLEDYRNRDLEEDSDRRFTDLPPTAGWRGIRRKGAEGLTRATRYEALDQRWIEMTIPWPQQYDRDLERKLLEGFSMVRGEQARRWRAFRVDVRTPPGWELTGTTVKPADVMLQFRHGRADSMVRRRGLAEGWYDGDLGRYLHQEIQQVVSHREQRVYEGRSVEVCVTDEPMARVKRLLKRPRRRVDLAWFESADQAVYHLTTISPAEAPVQPEAFQVSAGAGHEGVES